MHKATWTLHMHKKCIHLCFCHHAYRTYVVQWWRYCWVDVCVNIGPSRYFGHSEPNQTSSLDHTFSQAQYHPWSFGRRVSQETMVCKVKPSINSFQGVLGNAIHCNVSCLKPGTIYWITLWSYICFDIFLEVSAPWLSTSSNRFIHIWWRSEYAI